jgi:dolichol kinase
MVKKDAARRVSWLEELLRKVVHVSAGVLICLFYYLWGKTQVISGLGLCLFLVCVFEFLRLRGVLTVPLLRDREGKRIGSHAFFIMGSLLSVVFFCKEIAIASILMLTIGDTAAAFAQMSIPEPFHGRAGLGGWVKPPRVLVTMFCTSFVVGYGIVGSSGVTAAGAVGAVIADGVVLRIYGLALDDNLTIPLFAGLLMTLAS